MKHKKIVDVPASTKEVIASVTCDFCKKEIKGHMFETDEVTLQYRTGSSYPEGGSGENIEFDMCGKCFTSKLLPWAESQGAVPTITEWEY